jgi:formamidopyrimidine-DNA glycosylase
MPELPDVETFKRVLEKNALRKTIGNVVVSDRRILGKLAAATFIGRLQGAKLVAARRTYWRASIAAVGWLSTSG